MLNPILSFSATRRMRSLKTMLILLAYVAVMLLIAARILFPLLRGQASIGALSSSTTCYAVLIAVQFVLLVLIAPAMTSGAIAGERERQTLELLLVTNTRSFRLVLGKAMESFAMLAMLVVAGFPVMCLTLLTGGVTLGGLLAGELFLLASAFAAVSAGILASSLCRSTVVSGVLSYLLILGIGAVTALPMLFDFPESVTDVIYNRGRLAALTSAESLRMISPVLLCNPGYALAALLQGQLHLFDDYMQYQGVGRLLCEFRLMDKAGGVTIALISSGLIVLIGLVLLALAAAAVRTMSRKPARSGGK